MLILKQTLTSAVPVVPGTQARQMYLHRFRWQGNQPLPHSQCLSNQSYCLCWRRIIYVDCIWLSVPAVSARREKADMPFLWLQNWRLCGDVGEGPDANEEISPGVHLRFCVNHVSFTVWKSNAKSFVGIRFRHVSGDSVLPASPRGRLFQLELNKSSSPIENRGNL